MLVGIRNYSKGDGLTEIIIEGSWIGKPLDWRVLGGVVCAGFVGFWLLSRI